MPAMDAHSLLTCWERGRYRHALDRALLLHAVAAPDENPEALADRTLGDRNAALLRLRRELFGDELQSCVDCPECGERLEFALSVATLLARAVTATTHVWVAGLRVRLPTTRDLASVAQEPDEASAARKLLERLVCADPATTEPPGSLPPDELLTRALDDADPCIDFAIEFTCPACVHAWSAPFDVAGFLWEEIDVRARRLLDEVHVLARTYGWPEAEILQLSAARRGAYLERVLG